MEQQLMINKGALGLGTNLCFRVINVSSKPLFCRDYEYWRRYNYFFRNSESSIVFTLIFSKI